MGLRNPGITLKLALLFLLVGLLPMTFLGLLDYYETRETINQQVQDRLSSAQKIKAKQIERYFRDLVSEVEAISYGPHLVALLSKVREHEKEADTRQGALDLETEEYTTIWRDYGGVLSAMVDKRGYVDAFVMDAEDGHVLYSVRRESELGQNAKTGKLRDTGLGRLWRRVMASKQTVLEDFSRYAPHDFEPAAFVGVALLDAQGKLAGVFAVQINIADINEVMQEHTGLGKTGETYLVGKDKLMRSDSRFFEESTILKREVRTASADAAFQGETGCRVADDYRGVATWSCSSKLDIAGLDWALLAEMDIDEAIAPAEELKSHLVTLFGSFAIGLLLISLLLARAAVLPIRKLLSATEKLTAGELDVKVDIPTGDERGRLGEAFNRMAADFREVVVRAEAIAAGDYSAVVEPRSERDQLGLALRQMTENLRRYAQQNEREVWLQTGRAGLGDLLRGEQSSETLSRSAVTYLARYLNAQVATFYVAAPDGRFRRIASYAFTRRKGVPNTVALGEGLVGQAALERERIVLTSVPEDYIAVQSGLGEAPARSVVVLPLIREDEVKGVLELATLGELTEADLALLDQVADDIAIALTSAESRGKLQALLEQTQQQAEELEVQQEELRQTNEELEEQTKALRISEERLRAQQEQLETTNQELEERTEALEARKLLIEKQNRDLEAAREVIEIKAKDLEITGKYKSEFLANMSHELRTPLNSLLILSRLLIDNKEGNLNERQLEFCRTIHGAGTELLNLINDILDLSKVEAGKVDLNLERCDLERFLRDMRSRFEPVAATKHVELELTLSEDAPREVFSDGQRLGQVIKNLLSNAFKFTEAGKVSLDVGRPSAPLLRSMGLEGATVGTFVAFTVADTGIGIPADKRELIFEAFQQADGTTVRKYGGTGLGLSISRELARLLGGAIHLESAEGEGSRFTLVLPERHTPRKAHEGATSAPLPAIPVAPTPVPVAPPKPPPAVRVSEVPDDRKDLRPGERSILVVEDDPEFARVLMDLAREREFKVLVAEDGPMALHLADLYVPSAILLDLGLPGMDGLTVLANLKENLLTRHIPVHIISGLEKRTEAIRGGAVGYLQKPVNMDQLDGAFARIQDVISRAQKNLLVVEDHPGSREGLVALLEGEGVRIATAANGEQALSELHKGPFDCVVLDLGLPGMSGLELLEQMRLEEAEVHVPVIVFTGKELTAEERMTIDKYAERVVVKGVKSPERLIDETCLFLHQVEKDLPEDKRRVIRMLHDKEAIFDGKTVLLVDDDMRNVFALTSVLEERGLKLLVAADGQECLDVLDQSPDVALVLTDIMMPVMDGFEAMRRIRAQPRFKNLPIIALTAKAMKGDRLRCIEAGANDYLAKPVDSDKLLSMLRVWLYQ